MAKSNPWAERSGAERRRTFGGFALLYAVICVVAVALDWVAIAVIFGLIAAGLGIGWFTTAADAPPSAVKPEAEKPAWMQAMDDPDAPDMTLPEYRGTASDAEHDDPLSPFERPPHDTGSNPTESSPLSDRGAFTRPPEDPPTPTA